MRGARIAVFGLARSGLSVVRAARGLRSPVMVVDQTPEAKLKSRVSLEEARRLGAEVLLGWEGEFSDLSVEMVVTSPGVPMRHEKLQNAVAAGIEVVSEIEFAYRISNAPIVAITGTNGKSSTAVMTYLALKATGHDAVLCGNVYGSGYDEVPLTDAAMASTRHQVLVAEVSSFQLEWVREFQPMVAGITNISPDHLDRYESFDEYALTKCRIFAGQEPQDFAVVRAEDPVVRPPEMPRVLTFGYDGKDARVSEDGIEFRNMRVSVDALPNMLGHNLMNAAMAALMSAATLHRLNGKGSEPVLVPEAVVNGLREFRGLSHRMEVVGERAGVLVINNSMCTNPAAVVSSARSLRQPKHLLIGGSNKELEFGPLREYLEASGTHAYLFGRDAPQIASQLPDGVPVFETLQEAFKAAALNAKTGEVVMLAPGCASMDQFEDFRDRGNVFKQVAKEWLES